MNKIEELIEKLCPNGVEMRELGEVCEVKNGYTPSKKIVENWENGDVPWFKLEDIRTNGNMLSNSFQFVTKKAIKKELFSSNSIILSTTATIGVSAIVTIPFLCNQQLTVITIKDKYKNLLSIKYIYYYINQNKDNLEKLANNSGGMKIINNSKMKEFKILIPPIQIQEEIVKILDKLTTATEKLQKNLKREKELYEKRYIYYRDKLFNFEGRDDVKWEKIINKLNKFRGTKITAKEMLELDKQESSVKIFAGGKTIAFFDYEDIPSNDICYEKSIIVKSRGNIEFEYYDKPFSHKKEFWSYYSDDKNIDIKFIYYYLKLNENYFKEKGSVMQMPQISNSDTDNFNIPIPPISEQQKIVEILDKLTTATNKITEDIEKEIDLRQKQYEYYREKLLNFKIKS